MQLGPGSEQKIVTARRKSRAKVPDEPRLRAAVACLECKSHKQRCTGKHPCDRCLKRGVECIIPKTSKRAGGNTEETSRIEHMENILKLVMPGLNLDVQSLEQKYHELKTASNMTGHIDTSSTSTSTANNIGNTIGNTSTGNIGVNPATTNGTILPVPPVVQSTNSFVAHVHELLSSETNSPISDHFSPNSLRKSFNTMGGETFDLLRLAVRRLPPKNTCTAILSSFFAVSSANSYFYFEAKSFLAQVEELYAHHRQVQVDDANLVCILLMSLAIGSLFETVITQKFPTPQDNFGYPGISYYCGAKILASVVLFQPTVETVQCFLMMGLYLLSAQQTESSYMVFGEALRASTGLGLHNSGGSEEHRRLFWSLYCIERKVAIGLGRPETLPLKWVDVSLPEYNPSLDHSDMMVHVSNIRLATTISLLTFKIYDTWRSILEGKCVLTQQIILNLQLELDEWKKALPKDIDFDNLKGTERSYRGISHINFQYLLARIALGRPFLLLQLKNDGIDPPVERIISSLVRGCYNSAIKIIMAIMEMQKQGRKSVYSYMDYTATHSSCIVILAMMLIDPSDQALAYLEEGIRFLKFTTKYNLPTADSTNLILSLKDAVEHSQKYQEWIRNKEQDILAANATANSNKHYMAPIMGPTSLAAATMHANHVTRMPVPAPEMDLNMVDQRLFTLSSNDWFNSILADSSFSFIQDSSIEGFMFPEKGISM